MARDLFTPRQPRGLAEYQIAGLLWLDQHLQGTFTFPQTPTVSLKLKTKSGTPSFTVRPDACKPILSVEIYYTQHGQLEGEQDDRENTKSRFWRHAFAKQDGDSWSADLPLINTDKPLWVYANVLYPLDAPRIRCRLLLQPLFRRRPLICRPCCKRHTPGQLQAAGVVPTLKPTLVIETFQGDWEKEWFTYRREDWARRTHKVYDEQWQAPPKAKLALEVRSARRNSLVVGLDQYAAVVPLEGDSAWHPIELAQADFLDAAGDSIPHWASIAELRLGSKETLRSQSKDEDIRRTVGADWDGAKPEFRNLRWIVE